MKYNLKRNERLKSIVETRIPTEVRIKHELDIVTQNEMEGMEEKEC
jgi:hypothetical protein